MGYELGDFTLHQSCRLIKRSGTMEERRALHKAKLVELGGQLATIVAQLSKFEDPQSAVILHIQEAQKELRTRLQDLNNEDKSGAKNPGDALLLI